MNRLYLVGLILFFTPEIWAQGLTVSTIAGAGVSSAPLPAPALNEGLDDETGVAVDRAGNIYFGGGIDNVVYKLSGGTLSVVAGTRLKSGYAGDGGPATSALLNRVQGVAVDSFGNLYIADSLNYVIRKVSGGTITTIAGTGSNGNPVNGPATSSPMFQPIGVAADASGNVYAACGTSGGYVLKIANGTLTIVAGAGSVGDVTNGAPATTQPVVSPHFIAADSVGNLYIASGSRAVLKLDTSAGTLATVAGNGNIGSSGDGGLATNAAILPFGVAVDLSGNLFIADTGNGRIREVSNGIITTIAGGGSGPTCSTTSMAALGANLNNPAGIAISGGNVILAAANCIQQLSSAASTGRPSINPGGIVSASAFGEFTEVSSGTWIEIYGSNLASQTRSWGNADFNGPNAPTSLGGTTVTIAGQSAFVDYISPTQVNALLPFNVTPGAQSIVLNTPYGSTDPFTVTVKPTAPGLLAPASFLVQGHQYVGATFPDGTTYVLPPGAIPSVTSKAATPGSTIILYGVGFGTTVPSIPAGQVVTRPNQLSSTFLIFFEGTQAIQAVVTYAGLAPLYTGLYQFNVVVPAVPANPLTPITFTLGGIFTTQKLYIAVQ